MTIVSATACQSAADKSKEDSTSLNAPLATTFHSTPTRRHARNSLKPAQSSRRSGFRILPTLLPLRESPSPSESPNPYSDSGSEPLRHTSGTEPLPCDSC